MTIPWRKALEEKKAKALQEETAQAAVPAAGPRLTFEELLPDCQVPDPSNGLVLCRNPKCGVQMADKGAWAFCKPCMNILWNNKAVWNKIEGSEEQKKTVPVMFEELRDVGTGYDVETELVWCRWPDCGVFLKPRNNGVMAFCKPHQNAIPVVMRRRLEIQQQQFSSRHRRGERTRSRGDGRRDRGDRDRDRRGDLSRRGERSAHHREERRDRDIRDRDIRDRGDRDRGERRTRGDRREDCRRDERRDGRRSTRSLEQDRDRRSHADARRERRRFTNTLII